MLGKQGGGDQKQNPVLIIVLVVVIAAAAFMVFRTMGGGSRPASGPADGPMSGVGPGGPGMPGGPPGMMPGSPGGPGQMPGAPGQTPGAPGAQPAVPAQPAPGAAAPAPAPQAQPQAAPVQKGSVTPAPAAKPAAQTAMRQINVFGTVTVSYPASWKISSGDGNASAVFTNGKAFFEVRPPDPRATSAQAIAQSALKSLGGGAKVTAQGAGKIGQYDSYSMTVTYGGGTARIVGVDAPTRVVLFQRVKGAQFSAYLATFEKMQSEMRFGG